MILMMESLFELVIKLCNKSCVLTYSFFGVTLGGEKWLICLTRYHVVREG